MVTLCPPIRPPAVLLVALVVAIGVPGAHANPNETMTSRDRLELFMDACAAHGFEGSVIVVRDDEVLLRSGYGLASRGLGAPNRPDTLFDAGSVAKQFTAAAILRLAEMGELKLSDLVTKHVPELGRRWRGISIHHVLSHASGMPRDIAPARVTDPSRRGFLAAASRLSPIKPKDSAPRYSNLGYSVLAALIETVSESTFERFVREEVFHRAGMTRTHFPRQGNATPQCARGLEKGIERLPANRERFPWRFKGSVGVLTTVDELRAWDRALRARQVLSEDSIARMEIRQCGRYGYGVLVDQADAGTKRIWHSGATMGFESGLRRIPSVGLLVAVLANRRGIGYIARGLELIARDKPVVSPPEPVAVTTNAKRPVVGEYRNARGGQVRVRLTSRELIVAPCTQGAIRELFGHSSGPGWIRRGRQPRWSQWTWRDERLANMLNSLAADSIEDALAYGMPKSFCGPWALRRNETGALASWEHVGNVSTQVMQYSLVHMMFEKNTDASSRTMGRTACG